MKYFKFIPIIFCLLFSVACQPSQEDLNKEKRAEIIAVHDEVMPKMGKLKNLEKEAQTKIETLEMTANPDTVKIEALELLAKDLNKAYEEMFVWMRQYSIDDQEKSPEELKIYLEEQMDKITAVNLEIKTALDKADSVLKN